MGAQVTIEVTDKLQKIYRVYDDRKGRLRKAQEQKDKWTRVLSKGFDEAELQHRLQELKIKALSNHIQGLEISYKLSTHTAFYMETVSEAIPQSLLQTSALVIYSRQGLHCTKQVCKAAGKAAKRIDYVSLFSITMSLGSIMSKLYVFCKSPIDKVFQYKFCLCCHDVALVFYTISALFQMHAESDDAVHVFFLTRPVDMYAAIWCWQAFVLTTMVFLTGWILLICLFDFLDRGHLLKRRMLSLEYLWNDLRGASLHRDWMRFQFCTTGTYHDSYANLTIVGSSDLLLWT